MVVTEAQQTLRELVLGNEGNFSPVKMTPFSPVSEKTFWG